MSSWPHEGKFVQGGEWGANQFPSYRAGQCKTFVGQIPLSCGPVSDVVLFLFLKNNLVFKVIAILNSNRE